MASDERAFFSTQERLVYFWPVALKVRIRTFSQMEVPCPHMWNECTQEACCHGVLEEKEALCCRRLQRLSRIMSGRTLGAWEQKARGCSLESLHVRSFLPFFPIFFI